jgi:hypothetical protein
MVMDRNDVMQDIQERYRRASEPFNERQRRQWAAQEALRLGRGGIALVSKALRMSPNTIKRGIQEIAAGQEASGSAATLRIRKSGGGRKPKQTLSVKSTRPCPSDGGAGNGAADISTEPRERKTENASDGDTRAHSRTGDFRSS